MRSISTSVTQNYMRYVTEATDKMAYWHDFMQKDRMDKNKKC